VAAYWSYPEVASEYPILLARRGHSVSALVWSGEKSRGTEDRFQHNYTVYNLPGVNLFPSLGPASAKYPFVLELSQRISKLRPDIVDCQSHLFLTTAQAVRAARRLRIPSVVTVHGAIADRGLMWNQAQLGYLYTIASWIFRKTDLVRCLTRSDFFEIARHGCPVAKIRIVPNAVNTDFFHPLDSSEEENSITWVGRFVPEKGLRYLVEASRIVVQERKNVLFVLVGDGHLRQRTEAMVRRYGLSTKFVFRGQLSRKGVLESLQRRGLFVIPSVREGIPYSLLEAMSCGKAIVGSDIPGISDVITDGYNGLLVPPRSVHELADAILRLLQDRNLRIKVGLNARRTAVEEYGLEAMVDRMEEIYCESLTRTYR
jgi:colanic acid/amylovoran biosynthesis glycosyltransferase